MPDFNSRSAGFCHNLTECARTAARNAGALLLEHHETNLNVDLAHRFDIKLEVDRLAEAAIVDTIRQTFPDHDVLAEERGSESGGGEYVWIIDPLDGTVNYFYGLPYYCTSVACYARKAEDSGDLAALGEPLAGVVYAPRLDEMFSAIRGGGATLNGKPISSSRCDRLDEVMVATGFGSNPEKVDAMHNRSRTLADKVRKIRCLGAAALDMCNVAAGRLTAYTERGIRSWDIAAARLIVEEAGGRFNAMTYAEHVWDVLASGPAVHEALLELIGKEGLR